MVHTCCVKGCRTFWYPNINISFHRFPSNSEIFKKWEKSVTPKTKIGKRSVVCSKHFTSSDFDYTCKLPRLKKTAVPICIKTEVTVVQNDATIQTSKSVDQNVENMGIISNVISSDILNVPQSPNLITKETTKQPSCNENISTNLMEPNTNSKKHNLSSNEREELLMRKIHLLQKKLLRREEKIKTIQTLVKHLKQRDAEK